MNKRSGVTLIEILIAVSLLSLLSVAILVAMRMGFSTMERTDARLMKNRRATNTRRIIENEIQGFTLILAEQRKQLVPFAEWRSDGLRFVTSYSLRDAWRGQPQIAEIQVIPGENNQGVRLILNEIPYTGPPQAGLRILAPVIPGPSSFVLADKLTQCRFLFLEQIFVEPYRVWRDDWVAPDRLPLGIKIEMEPSGTLTVPLNVNRDLTYYQDVL